MMTVRAIVRIQLCSIILDGSRECLACFPIAGYHLSHSKKLCFPVNITKECVEVISVIKEVVEISRLKGFKFASIEGFHHRSVT
ncbi:hypothetical protein ASF69_01645 [Rhizobium sp. Leaf311]|nr:hypothetical protein ASF69_01645 [Rhizobium sp. Leaf311]